MIILGAEGEHYQYENIEIPPRHKQEEDGGRATLPDGRGFGVKPLSKPPDDFIGHLGEQYSYERCAEKEQNWKLIIIIILPGPTSFSRFYAGP